MNKILNYLDFKSIDVSVKYLSISAFFSGIGLGYFLSAYDKEKEEAIQFNGQDKVMCLLEPVLVNAGYHEMAEQIRKSS